MKYRHSLRSRITLAFCLFGVVLSSVYGFTVYQAFYMVENKILSRWLELELEYCWDRYQADNDIPLTASRFITSYANGENLPGVIREQAKALPEGIHSLYQYRAKPHYKFLVAVKEGSDGERIYAVLNASRLELSTWGFNTIFIAVLLGTTLLVVGLGIALGFLIARRVISPLVQLTQWAQTVKPDQLSPKISDRFCDDEVGFLAVTLEELMVRTRAFINRESEFTRNASHELRTPVTVIKGAVELLEALPMSQQKAVNRSLERIKRAINDMESLIKAFLCLARECSEPNQSADLAAIVKHAVEQHQHLLARKQLTVDIAVTGATLVSAPEAVVSIAVSNLIRNAFLYTEKGQVRIHISNWGVSVEDTGIGIPASALAHVTEPQVRGERSQGYGLGLSIVREFCQRFGWQLHLSSTEGTGTRATLQFSG